MRAGNWMCWEQNRSQQWDMGFCECGDKHSGYKQAGNLSLNKMRLWRIIGTIDIGEGQKYVQNNLAMCRWVHHVFQMDLSGIKPGSLRSVTDS
jgi:hypothetical protein